ncbi:transmembrane protein 225 isoform X1 [Canis lupus dingo]|uniref:transmembrane protein 225 isoform X1 n=1 Tax=Canis lupus dingo TaxID=286419 RepID=UPI000DC6C4FC|nr:transmembrane protein 225 isoform X1 [Canis lupus dingo]XP_038520501.1 transmembrane protein 225 isoform X3 [Canis lupus familiaris]
MLTRSDGTEACSFERKELSWTQNGDTSPGTACIAWQTDDSRNLLQIQSSCGGWLMFLLLQLHLSSNSAQIYFPQTLADGLEVVRIMMILCLSLSFVHNLFLGLEFTYFIPQTKYVFFITVFLSFFTGILLLCALILYQLKLKQGQSVYYSTYKITWIIFTAYLSVSFFMASGILSLLECKKSTSACACGTLIHTPERESEDIEESESSVKIVSLPENAAAPRSIVHTREGSPNRPQLQTRRVTWAL